MRTPRTELLEIREVESLEDAEILIEDLTDRVEYLEEEVARLRRESASTPRDR